MPIINDTYHNGLLADAAYVDGLIAGMSGSELADRLQGRMTPSLARYMGDNFAVVTQIGGLASSFEAITGACSLRSAA